jgi:hypothetical protein
MLDHLRRHRADSPSSGPGLPFLLNSVVLALFDWLAVRHVASQMRQFAAQSFQALRLFMLPLERMN